MTKKIFYLTNFLFIFSFSGFSQWGVKGGIDCSTMTGLNIAEHQLGFHIGSTYDIEMSKSFYFQPALLFSLNRIGLSPNNGVLKDGKIDRYLLELPLNILYIQNMGAKTRLIFDSGLYVKYGLWGNKKYVLNDNTIDQASTFDAYNQLDVGVNVGISFKLNNSYIGFCYQYSLTSAEKEISSFHYSNLRFSLGYKF